MQTAHVETGAQRAVVDLEALFQFCPEMLCIAGLNGFFKRVNPAFERVLGHATELLLDRPFLEFVHPADRQRTREVLGTLRQGVPAIRFENRYRCLDGSYRWLSWQAMPGPGDDLIYAVASDVTAQKQAQYLLQESHERYQRLLQAVTSYTYSVEVRDGVPLSTWHSEECLATTGYSPHEYRTNPRLWLEMVLDADRDAVWQCVLRVLANEDVLPIEHRLCRKDGAIRWVQSTMVLHRDDQGRLVRYDGLVRDITDRKLAEERFDLAVRGTDAGIWDWNLETGTVYYSPRWKSILGYEETEIGDGYEEWESRIHADDRQRALATLRAYLHGDTPYYRLELRMRHKDGSYRWIAARGVAVRDSNGQPTRMVGSHIDLTDQRRAERRVHENELQLLAAQRIQTHLLPSRPPVLPGYDIAGASYPAEFAGGDTFDYLSLTDGALGLLVGDVSGHGFAPALLMASTHAYLRSLARLNSDLAEIVAHVNGILIEEIEGDRFVTLILAGIDPRTQTLTYCNAGHPPGYLLDSRGAVKAELESTGMPLGIVPEATFSSGLRLPLVSGDLLLLVTDGVIEALSPAREQFGVERLLTVVRQRQRQPAAEIIAGIHYEVLQFSRRETPADDLTAVILKVL